jgi:Uma2 family endonuclease
MILQTSKVPLEQQQHIVLEDVSWGFYERLLEEIGDRHIRVTYDDGRIEIMSPLPKHDRWGRWIGRLIELLCFELRIRCENLGSTTFRSSLKKKGLEPDECFYIQHAAEADDIEEEFDAAIHPPPDLAIEIDITRRSIPRQPIYAALGVPEIWRFDSEKLQVLHLSANKYVEGNASLALPFLKMSEFEQFVLRRSVKDQLKTLDEFTKWAKSLRR